MSDLEKELINIVKQSIGEAVRDKLKGYNSPVEKIVKDLFEDSNTGIRSLIEDTFKSVSLDDEFRAEMKRAMHHKIARELTSAFGEGIFKKQINLLKSDHMLKARCITAIEKIIDEATT